MQSTLVYRLARLSVIAAVIICCISSSAQTTRLQNSVANSPAEICTLLRENYTSFQQCHSMTQAEMCAMAQLMTEDHTQAHLFDLLMGESNPDKAIRRVADFVDRYPSSTLLSYAYFFAASAYQKKGDVAKTAEYTSRSLKLEPDNLLSLILSVEILPLPQYLRKRPADQGKILQQAENEAGRALQLIPQIPKEPKEVDADYQKRLAAVASEVHGALGTIYLELASAAPGGPDKAGLAKSEREFQTAVTTTPHPNPQDYYRLGEAYVAEAKLDDAIQAFTKAGKLGQGTALKAYANEQIAQLKKRKAQGLAASNPGGVSGN